mmetsp:Transcript_47207/g.119505  ORF Transcript_47207/g.119505 Transcript_47207/m.119505 type:complete len:357 (-) Transcript_47207:51-1121(-)
MGDTLAKAVLFQAPPGPFTASNVVWDERPRGTPEGGVKRPFLWLERPGVQTTIIYFHGNAEDLMDVESDLQELSDELRVNVLAVEYPGYGLLREGESQGVTPILGRVSSSWSLSMCTRMPENPCETTIEGIDKAAAHALAYVISTRGIPASQVVLFGRSLGSGVAMRLAKYARDRFHWSVGGVVLQCPYISIRQVVSDYACSVGSFMIPSYYDNLATLKSMCIDVPSAMESKRWVPLLILHGEQDEIIWPYHGHTLYDEARRLGHPSVEALFPAAATHNRWDLHEDIIQPTRNFIRKHVPRLDQGVGANQQPGCFGPGSRPVRGQGRSYGSASCMFGASSILEHLLASDRDEKRVI